MNTTLIFTILILFDIFGIEFLTADKLSKNLRFPMILK